MHVLYYLLKDLDNSETREVAKKIAHKVFDLLDLNHNGKLERAEMLENFRKLEVYEKMKLKALFNTMPKEE